MKRIIIIVLIILSGCSTKNGEIQFCEGADTKGSPVNCGKVFSYGDLSVFIKSKEPFDTDRIKVKTYNEEENGKLPLYENSIEVKPEETAAVFDLSLYNEGDYKITVEKKDGKTIAEGVIKIIDEK